MVCANVVSLLVGEQIGVFREEISACMAVCTRYVMDACNCVRSITFFTSYGGYVVRACCDLTILDLSNLKHWVTGSHRTGINFSFLRGKQPNTLVFLLNLSLHQFQLSFICCVYYIYKIANSHLVL